MRNLKILIVEDDIYCAQSIATRLDEFNVQEVVIVHSQNEALKSFAKSRPDLALIDIGINKNDEPATVLQFVHRMKIPFIAMTQFEETDLYQKILPLQPLAFLELPLDYTALRYSIDSYLERRNAGSYMNNKSMIKENEVLAHVDGDFLFLKKGNKFIKVMYGEMLFVQAEGNYITIQTSETKFVIRGSLKKCLALLSGAEFMQVHRNYAINKKFINVYDAESKQVIVEEFTLPVGRSYRSELRKVLQGRL